jgi:iron-sulfur cluster assembly accessory protein
MATPVQEETKVKTENTQVNTIEISPNAIQVVKELIAQNNLDDTYALRIYVAGRSCSGYQYGMALDNKPQETDSTFEDGGIKLLIDEVSIQYMLGSKIDYINDERGKGFLVDNPNTVEACSCGSGGGSCGCESSEN